MEKAVDVAEKNMARFGLSQAEISSRRKWVMQTRRQVRCCRGACAAVLVRITICGANASLGTACFRGAGYRVLQARASAPGRP